MAATYSGWNLKGRLAKREKVRASFSRQARTPPERTIYGHSRLPATGAILASSTRRRAMFQIDPNFVTALGTMLSGLAAALTGLAAVVWALRRKR